MAEVQGTGAAATPVQVEQPAASTPIQAVQEPVYEQQPVAPAMPQLGLQMPMLGLAPQQQVGLNVPTFQLQGVAPPQIGLSGPFEIGVPGGFQFNATSVIDSSGLESPMRAARSASFGSKKTGNGLCGCF